MSIISGIAGLTAAQGAALINRGGEGGTAGLYDCKTILNEHRPVCTKEYSLTGKYLGGTDNPDVWYPIAGAGSGTIVYANRFLTLTSGTAAASASRCVIDTEKFPIAGNFEEVVCRIGASVNGAGGSGRFCSIGFQATFSQYYNTNSDRATFTRDSTGVWRVSTKAADTALSTLPIGRNLQAGDVLTVRLDRVEGAANINIVRFYVNGQKQLESSSIPAADCYAGIGVFANADTTTASSLAIDYFGCKYVP